MLWSAAACRRFVPRELARGHLGSRRNSGQQAVLVESGSKLPHSKALRVTNIFGAIAGEGRGWLPALR